MEPQVESGLTPPRPPGNPPPQRNPGGRPRKPGEGLEDARRRKESALADLREDEVKKRRGELHESGPCERMKAEENRMLRSGFLAVVSRVRARCPELTPEQVQAIDEEVRAVLTGLGGGEGDAR